MLPPFGLFQYLERYPLVEEIHAMLPNGRQLNNNQVVRPASFGLPNGPRGHRQGNTCPQGLASHQMADCARTRAYLDRISDAEVNSVLSQTLYSELSIGDMRDETIGSGPL